MKVQTTAASAKQEQNVKEKEKDKNKVMVPISQIEAGQCFYFRGKEDEPCMRVGKFHPYQIKYINLVTGENRMLPSSGMVCVAKYKIVDDLDEEEPAT